MLIICSKVDNLNSTFTYELHTIALRDDVSNKIGSITLHVTKVSTKPS